MSDLETIQEKRRNILIIAVIAAFVICLVLGIIYGISAWKTMHGGPKEKVFGRAGMSVTLTDEFWKVDEQTVQEDGYDAIFTSEEVGVMALKSSFTVLDELAALTTEQYAVYIITNSGITSQGVKTEDGMTHFEYDSEGDDGKTYRYYSYVYKSDSAFWVVQFAVAVDQVPEYEARIRQWAKTVKFME